MMVVSAKGRLFRSSLWALAALITLESPAGAQTGKGRPATLGVAGLGDRMLVNTLDWVGLSKANLLFLEATPRLVLGQSFQMTVGALDNRRNVVRVDNASWRSSDPTIVSVTAKGLITGVKNGRATITASVDNMSTSVRVTVYPGMTIAPSVASVEITPVVDTIDVGESKQYTATARDAAGVVIANAPITWRTADTSTVDLSSDGLISAKSTGSVQVVASAGNVIQQASLTVNNSPVKTITISPTALSVVTSDTATFKVSATRANGGSVPLTDIRLTARRGTVTGLTYKAPTSTGADTIVATTSNGVRSTLPVTVIQAPTVTPPPVGPNDPPPSPNSVALRLVRFDGGTGAVVVTNGVPLMPGQLRAGNTASVRLMVNGAEVPARIVALKGKHLDGSLRAILVQTSATFGAAGLPAELQIGTAPTLPAFSVQPVQSSPVAMAVPSTAHLIASLIVGPTRSIDSTSLSGYDAMFRQYADAQFAANGTVWTEDYYDRVLNHVAYWVRGGSTTYLRRAIAIALDYRRTYLEANAYGASPHWSQLEGLAVHYWLTGDEASRTAVLKTTDRLVAGFSPANMAKLDYLYNEGRIEARVLMGNSLSHALEGGATYTANATAYMTGILGLVRADGSFSWPNWCGLQANYMVALQNDAMVKYTELVGPDTRIAPYMKKTLDYLWTTQWMPAAQSFNVNGTCLNQGGTEAAADLNMFFVNQYAWYAKQTGNTTYTQRADEIAVGAVAKAWISPTKQFNQFYYNSFSYLAYRR